jgi:hypothetical protein
MYDLAIIGSGLAGATLARLIGDKYRVLLVDKRRLDKDPEDAECRKCCGGLLAPDAQKMLSRLGLGLPKCALVEPQLFVVRAIDIPRRLERYYQRFYINLDREKFDRWLVSLAQEVSRHSGVDRGRRQSALLLGALRSRDHRLVLLDDSQGRPTDRRDRASAEGRNLRQVRPAQGETRRVWLSAGQHRPPRRNISLAADTDRARRFRAAIRPRHATTKMESPLKKLEVAAHFQPAAEKPGHEVRTTEYGSASCLE